MKKALGVTVFLITIISIIGCSKTNASSTTKQTSAALDAKTVATAISTSVCKQLNSCKLMAAGVSTADCTAAMSKDLEGVFAAQKTAVDQTALDNCTQAIVTADCTAINSPQAVTGCGFL